MKNSSLGLFWRDLPKEKIERPPPEPVWLEPDYLPHYEEACEAEYTLFTLDELGELSAEKQVSGTAHPLIYDIECYINYLLIAFKCPVSKKIAYFEMIDNVISTGSGELTLGELKWLISTFCVVGFNNASYDNVIALLTTYGSENEVLKQVSDQIIVEKIKTKQILKNHKIKVDELYNINSIDLKEVAPQKGSLKAYAGRLHSKTLQDLPFPPETVLSREQITVMRWYCINDLNLTINLYHALSKELDLRLKMSLTYNIDLRSASDSQIAEKVITGEVRKLTGEYVQSSHYLAGHTFRYQVPDYIKFNHPKLKYVLSNIKKCDFVLYPYNEDGALKVAKPDFLKDLKFKIGEATYTMGIGGLHSNEKKASHFAGDDYIIVDRDIASNYPIIILNQGLFPPNMGEVFLKVYRRIVETRLAAKAKINKCYEIGDLTSAEINQSIADSLKIVINSSFGKFGSFYSKLFSPELMIQVTLTGQLSLLMLIERVEAAGIRVISGNTDGIVIKCPKNQNQQLNDIVEQWERDTDFVTEETAYTSLHSRDVNNYFAIKPDGKVKAKGTFADPGLSKNPTSVICSHAVSEYLVRGTPIIDTILKCGEIEKFMSVKNVNGGAAKIWDEDKIEYLGNVVRWYYANDMNSPIVYAYKGNKVGKSDSAKPLMTLPETLPDDINYEWYIKEANQILKHIGMAA